MKRRDLVSSLSRWDASWFVTAANMISFVNLQRGAPSRFPAIAKLMSIWPVRLFGTSTPKTSSRES